MSRSYEKDSCVVKQCVKCQEHKPIHEFPSRDVGIDERRIEAQCKGCRKEYYREYYKRHYPRSRERRLRAGRARREQAKHDERLKEMNRGYQRKYREKPGVRDRMAASARERRKDHRERMKINLRVLVQGALRRNQKTGKSAELVGCSLGALRQHIESLWQPNMSWENYGNEHGDWNLDHILCCELFDLTLPTHQRACLHYTNLQPLWAVDNMKKGDLLDDGRRARNLTPDEKKAYLTSHGYAHLFDQPSA